MNCMKNRVNDIRPNRKCYFNAGCLLMVLMLLATEAASRPPDEVDENIQIDDYPETDNIELHHVKIVDGVAQEDHPIIMYKEDFVNEDYDPNSKGGSLGKKYEDTSTFRHQTNQNKTENYQIIKPEKIYFDVLPQSPIVVADDAVSSSDDGFAVKTKTKRPKKYHHRARRDVDETEHNIQKRNPYYRHYYYDSNNVVLSPNLAKLYYNPARVFVRHPVQGMRQPVRTPQTFVGIGTRFSDGRIFFPIDDNENIDRDVFSFAQNQIQSQRPQRPVNRPQSRPTEGPQNPPEVPQNQRPQNQRPQIPAQTTKRPTLDLLHNSDPSNADFSGFQNIPNSINGGSMQQSPVRPVATTYRPPLASRPSEGSNRNLPNCVWAIVNCCNSSGRIRYSCFEGFGCSGAFWDLNPCADTVRQIAFNYIDENDY